MRHKLHCPTLKIKLTTEQGVYYEFLLWYFVNALEIILGYCFLTGVFVQLFLLVISYGFVTKRFISFGKRPDLNASTKTKIEYRYNVWKATIVSQAIHDYVWVLFMIQYDWFWYGQLNLVLRSRIDFEIFYVFPILGLLNVLVFTYS